MPARALLCLSLLFACAEASTTLDGSSAADARPADAALAAPDAAEARDAVAQDATPAPDAAEGHPDAASPDALTFADAASPDAAEAPDAGASSPDAGDLCGVIGLECGPTRECGGRDPSLQCVDPPGLCMPVMPTCGGFVMMRCPNTAPHCMFYQGADYGPCLTQQQRLCVCNDPVARAHFPGC